MLRATSQQIAQVTGARLVAGPADRVVEGVATDSRQVPAGGLFVAFPGERVDGNDFAASALSAGAAAVVMTREPDLSVLDAAEKDGASVLLTEQSGEAFLQALASWWRDKLDCVVVGITGSSGKTTTKEMTAAVLATTFKTHATAGNLNSGIGAPLTVLSCPLDAEALVVEMGMNGPGEIAAIAATARPHLGVVTNVGVAHVGMLGSRANIARAKAELVEALPPTCEDDRWPSRVMLCAENDFTPWIAEEVAGPRGVRVVAFGASGEAACPRFDIDELSCAHGEATLPSGASFCLDLAIPGEHNVANALAAAAVGDALGIAPEKIAAALAGVRPAASRQQVLTAPNGVTVIDDSYNANTDSMRRAVDVLCALKASRRVACLGDMGELGERAGELHAIVGAYVAAKPVDVLVAVGPLSARHMAEAASLCGMGEDRVLVVEDAAAAANVLKEILHPGDAVLVKASHSTGLDATVKAVMQPWA